MKHLYIILFVLPLIGFGQGWETTFGGIEDDQGYSVQQTSDEGYIITGRTTSFENGSFDIYLIKTNENGDSLWTKTFGGIDLEVGYSVQQTLDGGYVITGQTGSIKSLDFDVYLIKTDENGDSLWTKTFGGTSGDFGNSVQQTLDGGYIITGRTGSFGNGGRDVYLIKTDENGDSLWTKTFGGTDIDGEVGNSVQQTLDGGYIITGSTNSFGNGGRDVYLIKTNENGDSLWTKTFGGTSTDWGNSVQQTLDGGYIITGQTTSFGNGLYDIYLIKTDENGDSLWTKTFGGTENDIGNSVQQTFDGGYIITGISEGDVYLIKIDENGDNDCFQTFGGTLTDEGRSVQQTLDGGYIITGRTRSFGSGWEDVYLIKTYLECNGTNTSTIELPTPTSKRELIKTTNILGQENTTIKNQPLIEIYDDGSTEKKIVLE